MDRTLMGIFLVIAVGSVLYLIFGASRRGSRSRTATPKASASTSGAHDSSGSRNASSRAIESGDTAVGDAAISDPVLSDSGEADSQAPSGSSWMADAEAQTGANRSSLLEDEGLARANFKTPSEKEEGSKYSRSIFQPLEVTLFDQDKRDDLTRDSSSSDRSFNLFAVDEKNDLTRPFFEDDEKK